MGVETLFLAKAGMSLLQGVSSMGEAGEQADIAAAETKKAQEQAAKETRENIARNVTLFAKSGITLQGSPLLAIENDIQTGVENVEDIGLAGQAQLDAIQPQGRQAFLSTVGDAASSFSTDMGWI